MNLGKSIHQRDKRVTSKQLSKKTFKLIMKSSQKVISVAKLNNNLMILV
jgi:hypothetical protein